MTLPSIAEMMAFRSVADHRSFRRAADELGMSASTLSHTVKGLERRLGVRLLHRTTRSVATTQVGEAFRRRLDGLFSDLDGALAEVGRYRDTIAGLVRISAAAPAITPMLDDVVPRLLERYPEVTLEFVADGRMVDIVEDGFDAGIRFSEAVPRDMVGVPFGRPSRFVALASPTYLERHGTPSAPDDLLAHRCIRLRLGTGRMHNWTFGESGVARLVDPPASVTVDDVPLQVQAAAAGVGVAYVWEAAARHLIEAGSLRIVLEEWSAPASRLLLYYPANRRVPPALGALVEMLRAKAK
jgi:DNA-binding transcriptional LysR family regulator